VIMKPLEIDWVNFQMLEHIELGVVGILVRTVQCVGWDLVSVLLEEAGKHARCDLNIFGATKVVK